MRYEKIRKPIFCPRHSQVGDYQVKGGELIVYDDEIGDKRTTRIGRVLGLATHGGDGSEFPAKTLAVMVANETMTAGWIRAVPAEDVIEIRSDFKGSFALWFLCGQMPDPDEADRAVRYGLVNDNYIDRWLVGDELRFDQKWDEGVR